MSQAWPLPKRRRLSDFLAGRLGLAHRVFVPQPSRHVPSFFTLHRCRVRFLRRAVVRPVLHSRAPLFFVPPLARVLVLPLLRSFSRVRRLVASGSAGEICLPNRLWKTSSSVGGVPSNPLLFSPAGFPSVRVERSVVRKWPPSPKTHFALCSPIRRPRELNNLC
jgi:hypothetical protein